MIEIKVTEETTQITDDHETMEDLARDLVYSSKKNTRKI